RTTPARFSQSRDQPAHPAYRQFHAADRRRHAGAGTGHDPASARAYFNPGTAGAAAEPAAALRPQSAAAETVLSLGSGRLPAGNVPAGRPVAPSRWQYSVAGLRCAADADAILAALPDRDSARALLLRPAA